MPLPYQLPVWLLWVQALSVPALAVVGVLVAVQQLLVARTKLQHDLYDRRIKIYYAVRRLLGEHTLTGQITDEDLGMFWKDTHEAQFILPRRIGKVVKDVEDEALQLQATLRRAKNVTSQAEQEKLAEREEHQSDALRKHLARIGPMFDRYLHVGRRRG